MLFHNILLTVGLTLQRWFVKLVEENETQWEKLLVPVLLAYRTSNKQAPTKHSPFLLMYDGQGT